MTGCFVTGTDTGVGKTFAAAALLHALQRHHRRVVGMKPVAAGAVCIDGQLTSDDALVLRDASTIRVTPELDNPVLLTDPLSPHIAARRDGKRIDIHELRRRYERLAVRADFVVVEGAGGFHVPLSEAETGADLALALALPVVLVVGLRLGCLNHALLTAEAIRARGLDLVGWIANRIDPAMQMQDDNIAYLKTRLGAALLADIPHLAHPAHPAASSTAIELPVAWRAAP
jgi:dethiobiotin synthetase